MTAARLFLLGLAAAGLCRGLTLRIESRTVRPGDELSLQLFVETAEAAGHLLFDLSYPAGALEIRQTVAGDMASAQPAGNPDHAAAFLTRTWRDAQRGEDHYRFGWLYGEGFAGTGTVIALRVKLDAGHLEEIPLDLTMRRAVRAAGSLDDLDATAISGRLRIILDGAGARIVRVVTPASGSFVRADSTVAMQVTVSGNTREACVVRFFGDGVLLGSDDTAPYRLDWENVPPGLRTVGAEAEYADGTALAPDVLFTALEPGQQTAEHWFQPAPEWYSLTGMRQRAETQLAWSADGGYLDGAGHAEADLDGLVALPGGVYLAAYTTGETAGLAHFADAEVHVALNDLESAPLPPGSVRFFVGEIDPSEAVRVYVYGEPFAADAAGQWQASTVILSPDPARWQSLGELDRRLGELLDAPPLWGLAIVAPAAPPTGRLGIDAFEIRFQPEATAYLDLEPGWNLRSVPVLPRLALAQAFPDIRRDGAPAVSAWEWSVANQAYAPVPAGGYLRPGQGYWLHSPQAQVSQTLHGPVGRPGEPAGRGWGLLGEPIESDSPPAGILPGSVWGWEGRAYFRGDGGTDRLPLWQAPGRLMQTRAYWGYREDAPAAAP